MIFVKNNLDTFKRRMKDYQSAAVLARKLSLLGNMVIEWVDKNNTTKKMVLFERGRRVSVCDLKHRFDDRLPAHHYRFPN